MRQFLILVVVTSVLVAGCNNDKKKQNEKSNIDKNAKMAVESDQRFVRAETAEQNEQKASQLSEQLIADLQNQMATLQTKMTEAKTDSEILEIYNELNPVPDFVSGVLKSIEVFPGELGTLDSALAGLGYAENSRRDTILSYLLKQWPTRLDHEKIVEYLLEQVPGQNVEDFLRQSVASAPAGETKAKALMAFKTYFDQKPVFSKTIRYSPDVARRLSESQLEYIHAPRSESTTKEIAGYLQTLIDDYSDVSYTSSGMEAGDTFGEVAQSELFELMHLNVGDVAPEIIGQDLDGRDFKLSDYRGKVVMLDFWGHWCPPCRRMYPHERELVRNLNGLPFALIGVNSDPDIETARRAVKNDPLPWRNFWNGPEGTTGPISKTWNISSWPTFYLIDGNGVIRYKDVLGDDLRIGIQTLMAEAGHEIDLAPIGKVASGSVASQ